MEINNREELKEYFKTNKRPTEAQFANLIDSIALQEEIPQVDKRLYKVFSALLSVENNSLDPLNQNYVINHTLLEANTIGELNIDFYKGNEIIIEDLSEEGKLTFERRFIVFGLIRDDFNFSAITESARVSDENLRLAFTIKGGDTSTTDHTARPEVYNLPIEIRVDDWLEGQLPFPGDPVGTETPFPDPSGPVKNQ